MDNKPIATVKDGAVKVSIWANKNEKGLFYTVDLARIYKDDNDQWRDSRSLSEKDLLKAGRLLGKAHDFIVDHKSG